MRLVRSLLIFFLFWGLIGVFDTRADTPTEEKTAGELGAAWVHKKIVDAPPPIQEQEIALNPFFRLQKKGSKVWVERIILTFIMAVPKNSLQHDLNNPTLRKMFYDLLQSGESESTIQAQAAAGLNRHLGRNIDAAVQISRSILIVH